MFAGLEADKKKAGLKTGLEAGAGQDKGQRLHAISTGRTQGTSTKSRNGY